MTDLVLLTQQGVSIQKVRENDDAHSTLVGIFFVLASSTCFSLAAVVVRMDGRIPSDEIGFVLAVLSVLISGALLRVVYKEPILPVAAGKWIMLFLFARGLVDFSASNLYYFGCQTVNLGLATMIMFTAPFWAAILGAFWLGEPYTYKDFALTCVAFGGVVLSAAPKLQQGSSGGVLEVIVVFIASVGQACTYCLIKRLSGKCHFMQMTMTYGMAGAPIGSAIMYFGVLLHKPALEPGPLWNVPQSILTPLVALLAIFGQVNLNLGIARVPASFAALIEMINIPLAIFFQYAFFGQTPATIEVLGASLVVCACAARAIMKQLSATTVHANEGSA